MFRLFTFSWLFILSANNFAGTIHSNYGYGKWSSPPVAKGVSPKVLPWLEASHRTELDRLYKLTSDATRFGFNEGDFKMPVVPQNMTGTDSVNFNRKTTEIARYFFESLIGRLYELGLLTSIDGLNIAQLKKAIVDGQKRIARGVGSSDILAVTVIFCLSEMSITHYLLLPESLYGVFWNSLKKQKA